MGSRMWFLNSLLSKDDAKIEVIVPPFYCCLMNLYLFKMMAYGKRVNI
jgi:hypothetical protein